MTKRKPVDNDTQTTPPKKLLRIHIPTIIPSAGPYSPSSLFSTISSALSAASLFHDVLSPSTQTNPALLTAPPIPGLYFTPTLELPQDLAEAIFKFCLSTYFNNPTINQIMLFTRSSSPHTTITTTTTTTIPDDSHSDIPLVRSKTHLPPILNNLLTTLSTLLEPHIPPSTHSLLFPTTPTTQSRQVILNLYDPGEGISPHVDLLKRFGDGIIGVSLGSGCVMRFARVTSEDDGIDDQSGKGTESNPVDVPVEYSDETKKQGGEEDSNYDLYLPERSILVLSSDARYKWTHGIEKRKSDFVSHHLEISDDEKDDVLPCGRTTNSKGRWVERGVRLSITFRWLLPGADVVGGEE